MVAELNLSFNVGPRRSYFTFFLESFLICNYIIGIKEVIKLAKKNELNSLALGYAGAVLAALSMLLLGIGGNIGIYAGAANQMMQWHMFFSLSIMGILTGMAEAAILTFVGAYLLGWTYNKFL